MSTQFLLHQDGRWLAFDGRRVHVHDTRPRVDRASVVITDFDGAVSQVMALEGSPAHAVALIEKRLRADGLIDNESKILIHQTRTVGNGYQALFTAVPLDRWQQMFAWAESQPDHCLLLPVAALLWRTLKPGRGVVLHNGRQFVFVAALRNSLVYSSALAFSASREDLAMTVAALGERAGRELADGDDALEPLAIEWIGALTPVADVHAPSPASLQRIDPVLDRRAAHFDDDVPTERSRARAAGMPPGMTFDGQADYVVAAPAATPSDDPAPAPASADGALDEMLREIFSRNCGASVALAPHVQVTDSEGRVYRSGVPHLAQSASAMAAVNAPWSRAMYLAERMLPWASAASLALALGLGALGGRWALSASDANERADALHRDVQAIDARIAGLERQQALPPAYPEVLTFVERTTTLAQALDPNAALQDVRLAAGSDVRILRLRLDTGEQQGRSLRVDGVVHHRPDMPAQGRQVAHFVQRLREAGYVPVAIDPQSGDSRAQSPGGSFSYQLTRAPVAPPGGAS